MTPDKCEHQEKDDNTGRGISWIEPLNDGAVCDTCGQRFVPSDVLEEAREALWWMKATLPHVLARVASGSELSSASWEKANNAQTRAEDALARLDAVLGKT